MTSHPIEKAAALVVLTFSAVVLIATPWPNVDRLLGLSTERHCRLLPQPHPDCPATNGANSHN